MFAPVVIPVAEPCRAASYRKCHRCHDEGVISAAHWRGCTSGARRTKKRAPIRVRSFVSKQRLQYNTNRRCTQVLAEEAKDARRPSALISPTAARKVVPRRHDDVHRLTNVGYSTLRTCLLKACSTTTCLIKLLRTRMFTILSRIRDCRPSLFC